MGSRGGGWGDLPRESRLTRCIHEQSGTRHRDFASRGGPPVPQDTGRRRGPQCSGYPAPPLWQGKGADLSGVRSSEWLAKELVILGVRSDPEPLHSLWHWNAEGEVMNPDPDAAEASAMYGFES